MKRILHHKAAFLFQDRAMFDIEEDDAAVLATTSSDSSDDNEDEEDDEDDDIEGAVGGRIPAELRREGSNSSKSKERTKKKSKDKRNIDDDGLTYGLISRLYFYY